MAGLPAPRPPGPARQRNLEWPVGKSGLEFDQLGGRFRIQLTRNDFFRLRRGIRHLHPDPYFSKVPTFAL